MVNYFFSGLVNTINITPTIITAPPINNSLVGSSPKRKITLISKIGGSLLLLTGILILTNQLQVLGFYILEYLPILGKFG